MSFNQNPNDTQKSGFSGFKCYELPTYTVTCPISGECYDVRALTVGDIATLKSSMVSQDRMYNILNSVLWDCIIAKPKHISDYRTFMSKITIEDKRALTFGLYLITYGNKRSYILKCSKCNHVMNADVNLTDMFSMELFPGSQNIINAYKVSKTLDKSIYDMEIEDYIKIYEQKNNTKISIPDENAPEHFIKSFYPDYFRIKNSFEKEKDEFSKIISKRYSEIVDEMQKTGEFDFRPNGEVSEKTMQEIENKEKEILDAVVKEILKGDSTKKLVVSDESEIVENLTQNKTNEPQSPCDMETLVELDNKNLKVYIHYPKIYDEAELYESISLLTNIDHKNLSTDTLCIKRIEEYDNDGNLIQTITNRIDILLAFVAIQATYREKILDSYQEHFGKYGTRMTLKWECSKCGFLNTGMLDPIDQFFRAIRTRNDFS